MRGIGSTDIISCVVWHDSSTLLYPSLCWNELRQAIEWWPPIHGSVFFEQLPLSYLPDFGLFFSQKVHATYIAGLEEKIGVQILFKPPQIAWFLRAMSLFHNWGSLSKVESKHLWWSYRLLLLQGQHVVWLFQNRGASLNSGEQAGIWLWSNEAARGMEMIRNYFFSKLRAGPYFWKKTPPWK